MTPEPKARPTTAGTRDNEGTAGATGTPKTTGAAVGEWMTKRVDKALEVAERGVHAAHRLADVAERAIEVTERVLHAAGHPAVTRPDKVVDADPNPPNGTPPTGA